MLAPLCLARVLTPPPRRPLSTIESPLDKKEDTFVLPFSLGTVVVPRELEAAMVQLLKGEPRKRIAADADRLSEQLRTRTRALPSQIGVTPTSAIPTISYGRNEALAYAAHRLGGVYSCTVRVLAELSSRFGDGLAPRTMLDFGSGPGTTMWAAYAAFSASLKTITGVEVATDMQAVCRRLVEPLPVPVRLRRTLAAAAESGPLPQAYDLVTASYSLSELASDKMRRTTVRQLWSMLAPGGVLVIVEPGTPVGFAVVKEMRRMLLDELKDTARVLAPCPHQNACPMGEDSWCHFKQRTQRMSLQLLSKRHAGASLNWEDEAYSYVAIAKQPTAETLAGDYAPTADTGEAVWSRVVRRPRKRGGHVMLALCEPEGTMAEVTVTRSQGRLRYRGARRLAWGDGFLDRLSEPTADEMDEMMFGVGADGAEHEPGRPIDEADDVVDDDDVADDDDDDADAGQRRQ